MAERYCPAPKLHSPAGLARSARGVAAFDWADLARDGC